VIVWEINRDRVRRASKKDLFEAVYALTMLIPIGKVCSYKDIAKILGVSPRFVGLALKNNENPLITPCHRVVGSNGELRNYSFGGAKVKRKLLMIEGVGFKNSRVDKRFFYDIYSLLS